MQQTPTVNVLSVCPSENVSSQQFFSQFVQDNAAGTDSSICMIIRRRCARRLVGCCDLQAVTVRLTYLHTVITA